MSRQLFLILIPHSCAGDGRTFAEAISRRWVVLSDKHYWEEWEAYWQYSPSRGSYMDQHYGEWAKELILGG